MFLAALTQKLRRHGLSGHLRESLPQHLGEPGLSETFGHQDHPVAVKRDLVGNPGGIAKIKHAVVDVFFEMIGQIGQDQIPLEVAV